jgi:hypothetical protein
VANWSSSTIVFVHNPVQNAYEANFNTSEVGAGIFTVLVNASGSYHHNATTTFEIKVIITDNLLTLSDSTAETNLESNHTAEFTYIDRYGTGIESANVNISYTGPTNGLTWYQQEDLGLGSYRMDFTTNISGSYVITITGWKSYYESAEDTLFLLVGEYGSQISSPNGTADAISFSESYNYVFLYENTTGYGLLGANVSIVSVTPETGLLNDSIIDEGNGYYSVNLTPQQTGVFTILFHAEIQNHETQFISFTLTATVVGTQLTVEASSDLTVVGYPIYFTLNFTNEVGEGIENANISVVDPPAGLTIPPLVELGGGLYQYTVTATSGGAYQIRFKANATNHIDATAAYSFLVGLYTSVLTSLNGTSGTISYNQQYYLVVEFTNSSGYGLTGATVDITSINPVTGLNVDDKIDNLDGTYSILLTPTKTGIYTFQVEVSLSQYEPQIISFTLTSPEIGSILTNDVSSEIVSIGDVCTITLSYLNVTSGGISEASITIISPPSGLVFTVVVELGDGLYQLNITTTEVSDYQLSFRASAPNHLNATSALTLSVVLVPTNLVVEPQLSEYTSYFGEPLELHVYYYQLNYFGEPVANITNANITVNAVDSEGLGHTIVPSDGYYSISLSGDSVDLWEVSITAKKDGHSTDIIYINFRVLAVETIVSEVSSLSCYYGRSYTVTFTFLRLSNNSGIEGAIPVAGGRGSDWIIVNEIGSGVYNISFTPTDFGTYSVYLDFEKDGFETQTGIIAFEVEEIPLHMSTNVDLIWNEGTSYSVSVTLSVADTDEPVTEAHVEATLLVNGVSTGTWDLVGDGAGVYAVSIGSASWQDSDNVTVRITAEKLNYHLEPVFVTVGMYPLPILESLWNQYGTSITAFSALFAIAMVSVVATRRRNAKLHREAQEVKSTFDDANNLLGVLVLHKNSGLPFYSKILKGGFEEGMLSAFVTAVTHFRSEFESNGAEREWQLTPISDIIRAGPTKNLICAFVTMSSPSMVHEAKMLMFTREIGLMLDERMEEPPTEFRDDATSRQIDMMFDDHLDGVLLKDYRIPVESAMPRQFKSIRNARSVAGLSDVGLFCGYIEVRGISVLRPYHVDTG